jgi:hypothetical protein
MNFIIIHESKEKTKFRHLWKFVAGIAASLLILISGYLVYENQRQTYKDTFKNPYQAYAFAEETLRYVSSKYNKGLVQLTNFDKIEKASFPLKKGIMPFAGFIYGIEKMIKEQTTIKN